ncbi:hypothetical protein ACI6Q2_12535 [Chitinophagaceae bacterium LWZ2-11]
MKKISFYILIGLTSIVFIACKKNTSDSGTGLGSTGLTDMIVYRTNNFIANNNNIAGIYTASSRYNSSSYSFSYVDTASTTKAYNFTKAKDTSFLYFQVLRNNTNVGSVTVTLQDTTNTTIAYQQKLNLSDATSYTLLTGWDTAGLQLKSSPAARSKIYLARIDRSKSGAGDAYSPNAVNDFYHWPIILNNTYMVIGRPYNLIISWIDANNQMTADTVKRAIQITN